MGTDGSERGRSTQRFAFLKASLIGEGALSALIAAIVLIGVVWNLPDSPIRNALMPAVSPIALGTGLEQSWSMYAPNPPNRNDVLEVHVTMADGSDRMWTLPFSQDRVIGVAISHRWRKLKETLFDHPDLRGQVAHWVVGQLTAPSERAVRVQMIVRIQELTLPGTSGPGKTGVDTLYDEKLAGNP
jgi:hypothetical protein